MKKEHKHTSIRGLPYKTSTHRGRRSRNALNLQTNSLDFADKEGEGSKNPKMLWTSYMEAPCIYRTMLTSAAGPVMSAMPTPTLYTASEGQNAAAAIATKKSTCDIFRF